MKILTFIDHYLPGTRAGGQLRTLQNLVAHLPPGPEFWIVTRDRDHASDTPYPDLPALRWMEVGRAQVLYLPPQAETVRRIGKIASQTAADVAFTNSIFSRMAIRYQIARRVGLAPRLPLIVAPHGECSPGALGIHGTRKQVFLRVGAAAGLYRDALFQASTEREEADILRALPWVEPSEVVVAPDISATPPGPAMDRPPKSPGRARFVFISRVARMKNLHHALRAFEGVSGEVSLDVYGTADDETYLRECQEAAHRVPTNVSVRFHGAIPPERVVETFAAHDFSVLPTLGENFGHVIFESLVARCPVVLSDRTAWPDLGFSGAGFTVPVDDQAGWTKALQACMDMGQQRHSTMAESARRVALDFVGRLGAVRRNLEMFERCLDHR